MQSRRKRQQMTNSEHIHRSITEADDLESLREQIRDAVDCHFEAENKPKVIRLHFVREEVFAV